jgi:mannose-6-phosphate isomerase-like protein (cupin superfamily)
MIVQTEEYVHSDETMESYWTYKIPQDGISLIGANLRTRYPAKGHTVNEEIDIYIMALKGSAVLNLNGKEHVLVKGDVVFIPKKSPYWLRARKGKFFRCWMMSSTPFNWEQHKVVD